MKGKKRASRPAWKTDLAKLDAHVIQPEEYEDIPEATEEEIARAVIKKGGRPVLANRRKLISLRLPVDVIERWKATGPGWQTRMAKRLERVPGS